MARDDDERLLHMLDAARRAVPWREVAPERISTTMTRWGSHSRVCSRSWGKRRRGVSAATRDAYPHLPWQQMAATRDRLIHGYFSVDLDIIWQIVRNDLPPVIAALEAIVPDEDA